MLNSSLKVVGEQVMDQYHVMIGSAIMITAAIKLFDE